MGKRYEFGCEKCFNNIQLTEEIYKKHYKGHTLCMSCRPAEIPAQILTEEELLRANAALSFEIMLRKKYESFLKSVIRCGSRLEDECDFEWFKQSISSISNVAEVFK